MLALLTVGIPAVLWLLMRYLPRLDPKRKLDATNPTYQKLRLVVQLPLAIIGSFLIRAAASPTTPANSGNWLLVAVLLSMSLLGNYLATAPPNYFIGIRTPWTLESPSVWAKTHWLGGQLLFWGGLLGATLVLLLPAAGQAVMAVLVLGWATGLMGYSYWLYRQEQYTTMPAAGSAEFWGAKSRLRSARLAFAYFYPALLFAYVRCSTACLASITRAYPPLHES